MTLCASGEAEFQGGEKCSPRASETTNTGSIEKFLHPMSRMRHASLEG